MKNRKQRAWMSKCYCQYSCLDRHLLKLCKQLRKVKECFCVTCRKQKPECEE
ncbi:MAG: hypothetical protein HFI88_09120 [Lachnospiraceae bacterium]|nr:hypothetical protein [Lachnospiraceae bacterium]